MTTEPATRPRWWVALLSGFAVILWVNMIATGLRQGRHEVVIVLVLAGLAVFGVMAWQKWKGKA